MEVMKNFRLNQVGQQDASEFQSSSNFRIGAFHTRVKRFTRLPPENARGALSSVFIDYFEVSERAPNVCGVSVTVNIDTFAWAHTAHPSGDASADTRENA